MQSFFDNLSCAGNSVLGLNAFLYLFAQIAQIILGITGSLALLMFVIGGFMWLISGGSSKIVEMGRTTLINALIGLLIVLGSWLLIDFIMTSFTTRGEKWHTFSGKLCEEGRDVDLGDVTTAPPPPPITQATMTPGPGAPQASISTGAGGAGMSQGVTANEDRDKVIKECPGTCSIRGTFFQSVGVTLTPKVVQVGSKYECHCKAEATIQGQKAECAEDGAFPVETTGGMNMTAVERDCPQKCASLGYINAATMHEKSKKVETKGGVKYRCCACIQRALNDKQDCGEENAPCCNGIMAGVTNIASTPGGGAVSVSTGNNGICKPGLTCDMSLAITQGSKGTCKK